MGPQHSFDLRNHQTFPAKWSSLLYMQRVQSSKSKCYFQSCILFEYRARNFIFWKGLVIPQIKTMLRPHSNVSDLESWSVILDVKNRDVFAGKKFVPKARTLEWRVSLFWLVESWAISSLFCNHNKDRLSAKEIKQIKEPSKEPRNPSNSVH